MVITKSSHSGAFLRQVLGNSAVLNPMETKKLLWILAGLVWLLWVLVDARRRRPSQPYKIKRMKQWKLLRDKPADLKDVIYHPKEFRRPRPTRK